jgi:DNA repair exonuclease SbcCD ATPase subunit
MKLADPRTIQSNINAQRKVDIDQGVALARRVDTLREQISTLENKLILVRDGMTKEVNEQIAKLINDKTLLEEEIERLNITRARLLKPLDEEWELVKKEQEHIELERDEVSILILKTDKTAQEIEERRRELIVDEKRQEDKRKRIEEEAEEASKHLTEVSIRLVETIKDEKRISALSKKKLREIANKEAILQATVNDIAIREREIKAEYKVIHSEKVRLADERATLSRAFSRLNK